MTRLFVALDLPGEVREALAGLPLGEGWRRVRAESLHVTLAFLGEVEDDAAARVVSAVGSAVLPVTALSLGAVVLLPPRRPRVMAVTLGGDVSELQASVSAALAAAGLYAPEKRAFLPHVTVGRARERPSRELPGVPSLSFTAPSVSVCSSQLSPKGARYDALARFPVMTVAADPKSIRTVRLAALADSPASFAMTLAEEEGRPASWWEDLAARSAAGVTDRVFLAPGGGGMAAGHLVGADVELWGMWVAPAARGCGLGRVLLDAVVGWARSIGAARVVLSVHDGVPHAAGLYESAGFVATGREGGEIHYARRL